MQPVGNIIILCKLVCIRAIVTYLVMGQRCGVWDNMKCLIDGMNGLDFRGNIVVPGCFERARILKLVVICSHHKKKRDTYN